MPDWTAIVQQYGATDELVDRLLQWKSDWDAELVKVLIDEHITLTSFQLLLRYGLDIHCVIGDNTVLEYAVVTYPPHFYFLSHELCYRYRRDPIIHLYMKRYVSFLICASLDEDQDEREAIAIWQECYQLQTDLKDHQRLLQPTIDRVGYHGYYKKDGRDD